MDLFVYRLLIKNILGHCTENLEGLESLFFYSLQGCLQWGLSEERLRRTKPLGFVLGFLSFFPVFCFHFFLYAHWITDWLRVVPLWLGPSCETVNRTPGKHDGRVSRLRGLFSRFSLVTYDGQSEKGTTPSLAHRNSTGHFRLTLQVRPFNLSNQVVW